MMGEEEPYEGGDMEAAAEGEYVDDQQMIDLGATGGMMVTA